jgi:hypothetical protein
MKTMTNLTLGTLLLVATSLFAQLSVNSNPIQQPADSLQVAINKTTSLVFPFPIRSVDRGSQGLLVQKAKGVENTLQVKAAYECFPETSLTVITSDGRLYCYILTYSENPDALAFNYGDETAQRKALPAPRWSANEESLAGYCTLAAGEKEMLHGVKDSNSAIHLALMGSLLRTMYCFAALLFKTIPISTTILSSCVFL